jgi:hypothetical protein
MINPPLFPKTSGVGITAHHALAALAEVDNPTDPIRTLDRVTTRKQLAPKRSAKAFNPLARDEAQLFRALLDGQHIRNFSEKNGECTDKRSIG